MKKRAEVMAEDLHIQQAKDALHVLPLEMIPLATPGLKRTFLVKNARLETQIQIFQGEESGSGLISLDKLASVFPQHKRELEEDRPKLHALSTLSSFDVFSLRIGLRRLGIPVNNNRYLSLSPHTQEKLSTYMMEFVQPLMVRVYGPQEQNIRDFSDLITLFKNPDKKEALKNLRQMSTTLGIGLEDIPLFIEDYGDIFLSVAYYRSSFERIHVSVMNFLHWMEGINQNAYLTRDKNLMASRKMTYETLTSICNKVLFSLGTFQNSFNTFWDDVNQQSFEKIKTMVTANYEGMGGVLCGLSVKMKVWEERFPKHGGSPNLRADFLTAEIAPGLSHLNSLLGSIKA